MEGLSAQPIIIGRSCLGGYVDWDILTNVCVTLHRTLRFPSTTRTRGLFFCASEGGPGSPGLIS